MKEKKQSDLAVLLGYAGSHKGLTFLGLGLSAVAMVLGMLPYICIWLVARDLIAVAPNWAETYPRLESCNSTGGKRKQDRLYR